MIDVESYCRELEAYLCRKNDGHLIRITGPAFEQVIGWARQGIPRKVAEAGIDRYFERYYRKGPRRRPVRIDFCEADVLDAFDDWRRAVGISTAAPEADGGPDVEEPVPGTGRPKRSLASQLEAVLARLTVLRGSDKVGLRLGPALEASVRDLDTLIPGASRARGEARERLLEQLGDIDRRLLAAAMEALTLPQRSTLEAEAAAELEPFRARMAPEVYDQTKRAALSRLVRYHFGLPDVQ
ncbi:MAG: hypothetical protein ABI665_10345 [Vicinamibacterales bacterium]